MAISSRVQVFVDALPVTPLGPIWVAVGERGLVAVEFSRKGWPPADLAAQPRHIALDDFVLALERQGFQIQTASSVPAAMAAAQILEYLHGQRKNFDLDIDWARLRPFQSQVLKTTCAIPYGQTCTYAEVADRIQRPRAARAVGRAEATNPMPLVIPCHRVLGSDGQLHGYGGPQGITTKAWLLALESGNSCCSI